MERGINAAPACSAVVRAEDALDRPARAGQDHVGAQGMNRHVGENDSLRRVGMDRAPGQAPVPRSPEVLVGAQINPRRIGLGVPHAVVGIAVGARIGIDEVPSLAPVGGAENAPMVNGVTQRHRSQDEAGNSIDSDNMSEDNAGPELGRHGRPLAAGPPDDQPVTAHTGRYPAVVHHGQAVEQLRKLRLQAPPLADLGKGRCPKGSGSENGRDQSKAQRSDCRNPIIHGISSLDRLIRNIVSRRKGVRLSGICRCYLSTSKASTKTSLPVEEGLLLPVTTIRIS